MKTTKPKIAVIGGSGFYSLLDKTIEEKRINTPFGPTSGNVTIGQVGKTTIAFLSRHGENHQYPPHKVPYKANLWALKELGIKQIITCTAVGSLQKEIKPGSFVILDQFVDYTRHRESTYFNGPITTHISTAYPYCKRLRKTIIQTAEKINVKTHPSGTAVIIEGPRFSTAAESIFFTNAGWDVVNMTQFPEVVLARELEMCYSAIALVTDYDAGVMSKEKIKPVSLDKVISVASKNNLNAQKLIKMTIASLTTRRNCDCKNSLKNASF